MFYNMTTLFESNGTVLQPNKCKGCLILKRVQAGFDLSLKTGKMLLLTEEADSHGGLRKKRGQNPCRENVIT